MSDVREIIAQIRARKPHGAPGHVCLLGPRECRFGDRAPAAARFHLSAGCFCYPEDRYQDLCVQHILRANPRGTMVLVEILEPDLWTLVADRFHMSEAGWSRLRRRLHRALWPLFGMWLLLSPGDNWTWIIVGSYSSERSCEWARYERWDGARLICAEVI